MITDSLACMASRRTCPCGKTSLADIPARLQQPRLSCMDPLPTCGQPCGTSLQCGHTCSQPCHNGPCPPCHVVLTKECRCGRLTQTGPCFELCASHTAAGHVPSKVDAKGVRVPVVLAVVVAVVVVVVVVVVVLLLLLLPF